jgi:membrane-associated phospholipid phosphatase
MQKRCSSSRRATALLVATALLPLTAPAADAPSSAAPAGPSASASETPGGSAHCRFCAFAHETVHDARDVLTAPARWQRPEWRSAWRKAIIVAGVMALADRSIRDAAQERRSAATDRLADTFEPFGERYAAATLAGFWLAGRFGEHTTAHAIARDGLESEIIAAGLIVPALKFVTGRSRPREDLGTSDFHPFNGGASFPSGHTTAAFALAATIAEHEDRAWIKGLAYGVASLVGYARIDHDAHFASDVTAGAFIGVGVAKRVARLNRTGHGVVWAPTHDAQGWGIAFARSF